MRDLGHVCGPLPPSVVVNHGPLQCEAAARGMNFAPGRQSGLWQRMTSKCLHESSVGRQNYLRS